MIKLLVISNIKCYDLAKFLEQRGTFDVLASYNSLSDNIKKIQSDIVKVDKMLYLYQVGEDGVSSVNIKSEMQYLQLLLEKNSFFNPGDITFLTQDTSQCKQAVKYFRSVMDSCNYKKFTVEIADASISYMDVYNILIGASENNNFDNTYRTLYRKEVDEDSSVVYNRTKNLEDVIEPFSFRDVKNYDEQKDFLAKSKDSNIFRDVDAEDELFTRPILKSPDVVDVLKGPDVYLVSGKSKSGASTWCSALASSASKSQRKILVLDFSENEDVSFTLAECNVKFTDVKMKELLRSDFSSSEGLSVVTPVNDREYEQRLNFLRKIFEIRKLNYDVVFILVTSQDFSKSLKLLNGDITKVIMTVVPRYTDVLETQKYIDDLRGFSVMIVMNEILSLNWEGYVSQEQVKEMLSFYNPKVVKSITFSTVDIDEGLFNAFATN